MNKNMDTRRMSASAQEDLRHQVAKAVIEQGMSLSAAARIFGVSRTSVHRWVARFHTNGSGGLTAKPRGRPRSSRLQEHRVLETINLIKNFVPIQLGLPQYLWSREAVGQLILSRFDIQLSPATIGRYLKRWGFATPRPQVSNSSCRASAINQWFAEEYPVVRRLATREEMEFHWCEVRSLWGNAIHGTEGGTQQSKPFAIAVNQLAACHMISVITNQGKLLFDIVHGTIAANVIVQFFDRLISQCKRRLCIVVSTHHVFRCNLMEDWLREHRRRIQLFFAPFTTINESLNVKMLAQDCPRNMQTTRK